MKLLVILLACATSPILALEYKTWSAWQKNYVSMDGRNTRVNYEAAKISPAELNAVVKEFSDLSPVDFEKLSGQEQTAFLLNAYNVFAIKLIVDHYPVTSIKKIGSFFKGYDKQNVSNLLGTPTSLDDISNRLAPNKLGEPRVWFALVPAAKSAPNLAVYSGAQLDLQLDQAANGFLSNPDKNRWDKKERRLFLSKLFDWYEKDFRRKYGDVLNFIAPRLTSHIEDESLAKMSEVKYLDFDWSLNSASKIDTTH